MKLQLQDWCFAVDLQGTKDYSQQEAKTHCDCAYCRNFYAAVDAAHPELRPFLAQFGVSVEAPEELIPITAEEIMVSYAVCGAILTYADTKIPVGSLFAQPEDTRSADINVFCPEPNFVLSFGPFSVPWVLPEDPEEVVSPANEPSFLRRIIDRLLGKA